jgi:hypothetical protein
MAPVERVYLEAGKRRTFACSLTWPGWCRQGRDADAAIAALLASAARYAQVASDAGLEFASPQSVEVVERLDGSGTTDFGAPAAVSASDVDYTEDDASRAILLLRAAWRALSAAGSSSAPDLTKGPRGGGRDRDAMMRHVVEAEVQYARKLGVSVKKFDPDDPEKLRAMRASIEDVLSTPTDEPPVTKQWPRRYGARRVIWHVLDHLWELEDRQPDSIRSALHC